MAWAASVFPWYSAMVVSNDEPVVLACSIPVVVGTILNQIVRPTSRPSHVFGSVVCTLAPRLLPATVAGSTSACAVSQSSFAGGTGVAVGVGIAVDVGVGVQVGGSV